MDSRLRGNDEGEGVGDGCVVLFFFVNKKHRRGGRKPVFFLCTDTETVNAVGIISIRLASWHNQTILLRYSTYH